MIIGETYVKDSFIGRMKFVDNFQQITIHGRERKEEIISYADIYTTSGSQVQIRCTHEEYKDALTYLSYYHSAKEDKE